MLVCAYQVEYAVLKAASEGRWEEINQVFNTLGQQERVLHAQNEVICTEQHTGIVLSFLIMHSACAEQTHNAVLMFPDCWSFLFNAVWMESPPLRGILRSPQNCQSACECVQTSPRAEDQGTYRWPRTACMSGASCPPCNQCLSP